MKKNIKTLSVKKCELGFGITDGKKWFDAAYLTEERALKVLKCFSTPGEINTNISYDKPSHVYHGPLYNDKHD